jgi:PiT family inorganic phosphate transporter
VARPVDSCGKTDALAYDDSVTPELLVLGLVVITALSFDFTNGFHDTANAMATSIATRALSPKAAVTLCAILNLVGAFLSVEVALTVTNAVIKIQNADGTPKAQFTADGGHMLLLIILSGLVGAIVWNLLTWLWGLPSSSSHALFGGLIGATMANLGPDGIKWIGEGSKLDGIVGKVILPGLFSPVVAGLVAMTGTWLVFRVSRGVSRRFLDSGFRWGQIGTASLMSLSHGTNDAQKTMGVITLALIGSGMWTSTTDIPWEVKCACAGAIALGTYIGGWRIIRTMGKGLVEISPPQGMAAECASACVILASSHLGFALSTTHVATGSIMGTGLGMPGGKVRWGVAGRMGMAWLITLPCSGAVGALMWFIGNSLGAVVGPLVIFVIMVGLAIWMFVHSQSEPVSPDNVNDEWEAPAPTETPAGA